MIVLFKLFDNALAGIEIPYDKTPFYATIFSLAVIILWVAYFRKKESKEIETPNLDSFKEIQQFDVLSQPISFINNVDSPKEGILFNNSIKSEFLSTFLTSMIAFIIFGVIIILLK